MKYNIPEEIISKIPDYFWASFAGELISIYGQDIFKEDAIHLPDLFWVSGTGGWNAAFNQTCHKLDMDWLYEYYDKLEWWESDMFDSEFEDLIMSEFVRADWTKKPTPGDKYYQWLIREGTDE